MAEDWRELMALAAFLVEMLSHMFRYDARSLRMMPAARQSRQNPANQVFPGQAEPFATTSASMRSKSFRFTSYATISDADGPFRTMQCGLKLMT